MQNKGEYVKKISMTITISVFFLVIIAYIIDGYGQKEPTQKQYDAIIVAGCKVKRDGTPSLALQARVRKAISLYEAGYSSKIIFTGGSPDSRPTEALAAKKYALSLRDFSSESLFLEDASTSTETNASFTKERYPNLNNVIIVSDSYHIYRAEKIFQKYFAIVDGSGRIPEWNVRGKGALREIPAIIYHTFMGNI